ncbi:hypothetical protein [Prochlorococcus sp. MIT 1300]|uniref:hypothetical protein n=1 Tax=Prochlorococcus sp. MIT 1300 TaxID=3096218 RepID=UPI002A753A5F|nr:hypothetical protein [Prochlorococcus sp. MIT 1300]
MAKETTHRAEELKALGWSTDEVNRYAELWDYRQRWGAINLEREDRQFLRKAESVLPEIVKQKHSVRKSIQEKSYYRWLRFYLDSMDEAESKFDLLEGERGVWAILLEEELRLLDYYKPVLGLPDTLKAKGLLSVRESLAKSAEGLGAESSKEYSYDFESPIELLKSKEATTWKPLRESLGSQPNPYLVLSARAIIGFRSKVRSKLTPLIREILPSLKDTELSEPLDDWQPE